MDLLRQIKHRGPWRIHHIGLAVSESERRRIFRRNTAGLLPYVIATAIAPWHARAKAAFKTFQTEQKAYIDAHENQVDMSGTLRGAFAVQDEAAVRDQDFKWLQQLNRPGGFSATPTVRAAADAKLNAAYKSLMAKPWEYGTVKPDDMKGVQREWIKYRDAWLALAKARVDAFE